MKGKTNLSSRREFLATTSAVAASGSALAASKKDGTPFRIDVQSHMFPPPVLELMMTRDTVPRAYKNEGGRYPKPSVSLPATREPSPRSGRVKVAHGASRGNSALA